MTLTAIQKEVLIDCANMEEGESIGENVFYLPVVDSMRAETRTMKSLVEKGLMGSKENNGKLCFKLTPRGKETAKILQSDT